MSTTITASNRGTFVLVKTTLAQLSAILTKVSTILIRSTATFHLLHPIGIFVFATPHLMLPVLTTKRLTLTGNSYTLCAAAALGPYGHFKSLLKS